MSKQGQDCYFFFYSSCAKGDSCAFRHCEAAIGNETVCTLWQEGRCFRQVCKFRHMEIDKKRSEIPCFWENQLSGCQKANCAFHHTKGRFVDGIFFPPSQTAASWPEPTDDEVKAMQPSLQQDKLPGLPNTSPQLRGVIKVDHENVPSPTHPPVIINAADDDDDAGGSINVGVRSMRQSKPKNLIEHGNQLGSGTSPSICTAAVPKQGLPRIEKNIRSVMRTVTLSSNPDEEPRLGLTLAERLEKRKHPFTEASSGEVTGPSLKRSLAERLGRKIKSSELSLNEAQKKVHFPRSIKERLGFPNDQSTTETDTANPPGEIYIKTLEEIRLEKLSQKQEQDAYPKKDGAVEMEDLAKTAQSGIHIKSFIELLAEKKLRQMEEVERHRVKTESSEMVNNTGNDSLSLPAQVNLKSGDNNVQTFEAAEKRRSIERVRVKTLEEIKREKALRLRKSGESAKNGAPQAEPVTRGRRLLLNNKPAGGKEDKLKVEVSVPAALRTSAGGDALQECLELSANDTNPRVLVKSFEEIMREKRQRKQQEAAVQLLKEHTPLSLLEGAAPKENSEESLATAVKDPAVTLMQQVQPQRSLQGKTLNQLPSRQISSPLQALQTSPVRSPQSRLHVSSPSKSQEPSSPVRPQEQSSLVKSQEPSSSVNFNPPSSPAKTEQPSSPVKPHQPFSLGKPSPEKPKQLSLLVKPQQPSSPVKPLQPSSQLKAQQPSPMKPQKPSSPVTLQHPSSPVHAHQLSLLVRPQQPSSPVRSPQSTSPAVTEQSCSPVRSSKHSQLVKEQQRLSPLKDDKPSLPDKPDQQALLVHVEQPSTSLSLQQPSQVEGKQSSPVMSKDLSPVRQQETLMTMLQETTDAISSKEGFSSADAPADEVAKGKGKPKASVKPSVGRKQAPAKGPQKRKGGKSKPTAVAAVKPMSPSFPTDEPPAKKAAQQAVADNSDSVTGQEKTTAAGSEASDESVASLEAMQAVPKPTTEIAVQTSSPSSVKTRRSSTSGPKTPLPAEDDFEKLMWELSGGRLEEEAEIDLDAGKDEDDLLLELSEMIDS